MIDLRRDFFIRLAISAQKKRHLNRPFRVRHVDNPKILSQIKPKAAALDQNASHKVHPETALEKEVSKTTGSSSRDVGSNEVKAAPVVSIGPKVEKIDEKVDNIINDPLLIEVQVELEFAEQLLKKVREADMHNPKIPIIEQTIIRLRELLNQKMYV